MEIDRTKYELEKNSELDAKNNTPDGKRNMQYCRLSEHLQAIDTRNWDKPKVSLWGVNIKVGQK